MDKPKPEILQVKAPTKWDILKSKTKHIEQYLKGRFIEGGERIGGSILPQFVHTSKFDDEQFSKKHRIRRKKLKKISYKSKRRNRQ